MNLIFIGYILIFFHFKINGIDILPDFVGYLLIANGLGRLEKESELFVKARPWAFAMSVVSIFYGDQRGFEYWSGGVHRTASGIDCQYRISGVSVPG